MVSDANLHPYSAARVAAQPSLTAPLLGVGRPPPGIITIHHGISFFV